MTSSSSFLGGATGRLLPAWIVLRYFGTAVVFHLAAWLTLAAGAAQWPGYAGGPGWVLAALHLVTLGVLGMTAIGAAAQLLPVASRQPAAGHRALAAIWWLYTPGVATLALGLGLAQPLLLGAGAGAVSLALAAWAALMARSLLGARGMAGVVAHSWAALGALAVVLVSAWVLAGVWLGLQTSGRDAALSLHRIFGPYGFMGLLVLGLSYILVPMFALADAPAVRTQLVSCTLALAALVLATLAVLGQAPTALRLAALLAGAAAAGIHLQLMLRALRTGMRRNLGRSFTLVRLAWLGMLASLALAFALVLQAPVPRLESAFGLCLIGVWLLSLLLGMLQRIAPFLAAIHAGAGRRAPTPSSLTHQGALRIHFGCHVAALGLLALAIALDSTLVAAAAAVVGSAGAVAFGVFYNVLLVRRRLAAG